MASRDPWLPWGTWRAHRLPNSCGWEVGLVGERSLFHSDHLRGTSKSWTNLGSYCSFKRLATFKHFKPCPIPQGPPAKTAGRAGRMVPLSRQTLVALHHRSHGLEQMLSPAQSRDDSGPDSGSRTNIALDQKLRRFQPVCFVA